MRYLEVYGFSSKSRILHKNALEFIFSHQTVLVASQFGVTESIPVTFWGPRGIRDASEQFLSLKGPQNAIFGENP